jgi:hypothetical protein
LLSVTICGEEFVDDCGTGTYRQERLEFGVRHAAPDVSASTGLSYAGIGLAVSVLEFHPKSIEPQRDAFVHWKSIRNKEGQAAMLCPQILMLFLLQDDIRVVSRLNTPFDQVGL